MKKKLYDVEITWRAYAVVQIEARSADEAELKAREKGIPWDKASEDENGNGFDVTVMSPEGD